MAGGPGRIRTSVAVKAPDLQSGGISHSPTDPKGTHIRVKSAQTLLRLFKHMSDSTSDNGSSQLACNFRAHRGTFCLYGIFVEKLKMICCEALH